MKFNLFTIALLGAAFMSESVQTIKISGDEDLDYCSAEIDTEIESEGSSKGRQLAAILHEKMAANQHQTGMSCNGQHGFMANGGGCGGCGGCNKCNGGPCNGSCNTGNCCSKDQNKPLDQRVREYHCIQKKMCKGGDMNLCKATEECDKEEVALTARKTKCEAFTAALCVPTETDCVKHGEKCQAKTQKEIDDEAAEAAKKPAAPAAPK